jgi:hypothetical protein
MVLRFVSGHLKNAHRRLCARRPIGILGARLEDICAGQKSWGTWTEKPVSLTSSAERIATPREHKCSRCRSWPNNVAEPSGYTISATACVTVEKSSLKSASAASLLDPETRGHSDRKS